jgi:hypothetical protein
VSLSGSENELAHNPAPGVGRRLRRRRSGANRWAYPGTSERILKKHMQVRPEQ